MHTWIARITAHGYAILFAAAFLETFGLPIPAALALLIAGAAAARGILNPWWVAGGAFGCIVTGDTLMFLMGRHTGWWLLSLLCRLSFNPESCILRSADAFYRRGRTLLIFAKFLPGINTMAPPLAGDGAAAWYRIRVRPLDGLSRRGATLWSVSDITRERERHESFFQDLQHAIDYLDHAPAGFFSADPDGSIAYMNATLANWLDYDIAQFAAGQLKLADIVAGDGAALLSVVSGRPGEVTTERFDVDLKRRGGQFLPVRLLHRVALSSAGLPGPSRTLALNRAPGEDAGDQGSHAGTRQTAQ